MKRLALLCVACSLLVGCGSSETGTGAAPVFSLGAALSGWRAVPDEPGIGELAPDLAGLSLSGRTDSPALVHDGDVVRTTALTFLTPGDAGVAFERAKVESFVSGLEKAFRARIVARTATGEQRLLYRLEVPRPAEPGSDTAELYFLRSGRKLTLVELVSATGFDPRLRETVLAVVSR